MRGAHLPSGRKRYCAVIDKNVLLSDSLGRNVEVRFSGQVVQNAVFRRSSQLTLPEEETAMFLITLFFFFRAFYGGFREDGFRN